MAPDAHATAQELNDLLREIHDAAARFDATPGSDVAVRRRIERDVMRLRRRYTRLAQRHARHLSLLRTCRACSETWTIDPASAMRLQEAVNAAGRKLLAQGDREADLARMGRAIDAFNACPSCGSVHFDEQWA